MESNQSFFERKFLLSHHRTDVKAELMAGLTAFMIMSYILIANPDLLSQAGMDKGDVFTVTILASIIAMLLMGLYVNMSFALLTGMGLNAFFTYTVCLGMDYKWSFALTTVFLEDIIFISLSFFSVREVILTAIPHSLKKAVSVGIGLFIALTGFTSSGLIIASGVTYLVMGDLLTKKSFIAIVALFTMTILIAKQVQGALLYGVIISAVLALITGVAHFPGVASLFSLPPSIKDVAFHLERNNIFTSDMFSVMFTFLSVDVFDTIGTLTGAAAKAGLTDGDRNLPGVSKTLLSDAVGTIYGTLLGTSTITTSVESTSGVADGGRTGLTSLPIAFFFFIFLFLFPLFSIMSPQVTAAALIMIGLFMIGPITEIDFSDYTESVPAFLTVATIPFAYSVAEGIPVGMISYVIMKAVTGQAEGASVVVCILAPVFLLRYLSPLVF